jgi:hypothetical protein
MLEGGFRVRGGVDDDESILDWTEHDDAITWIPGPGEPWKPREIGID